jgi:hypothetical protein
VELLFDEMVSVWSSSEKSSVELEGGGPSRRISSSDGYKVGSARINKACSYEGVKVVEGGGVGTATGTT